MIKELQIRVSPQVAAAESAIREFIAREQAIDARTICHVRVLKRSIDARQRNIVVNLTVRVYVNEMPADEPFTVTHYGDVSECPAVVVVGAGPGGLFAALRLIELHLRPIVIERGKDVRERKKDLAAITRTQQVDPESNYCFGEGGAGAYSDGKLYTRSKKRGSVDKILNVFCQHGASTAILTDAHPHIGTDKLPRVIENMRSTILRCGGEVHFQTKMTALTLSGDEVVGVETLHLLTGQTRAFRGPVILATGHSARDVYQYLAANEVEIEAKGIAVGVRLEHPSALIDRIQYHNKEGRGRYLPAAEYSFVTQAQHAVVQQRHGGGTAHRRCGGRRPAAHDAVAATPGAGVLAAGQPQTDGARTAHGRLREGTAQLRPAQEQLCAGTYLQSAPFLAA